MNRINRHPQTNPLIQRVRRHAGLATLFRTPSEFTPRAEFSALPVGMPTTAIPDIQKGTQPATLEPPKIQPRLVLESNLREAALVSRPESPDRITAPAQRISPPEPQFQDHAFSAPPSRIQPFPAVPIKTLETALHSEPGPDHTAQQTSTATSFDSSGTGEPTGPGVVNSDWPRLHDILHRHEIKQAQMEQAEAIQPVLAGAAQVQPPEPGLKTTVFKQDAAVFEQKTPAAEPNSAVYKQVTTVTEPDTAVSEPDTRVAKLNLPISEQDTAVSKPNTPVTKWTTTIPERDSAVSKQDTAVAKDKTASQVPESTTANSEQMAEQDQRSNFSDKISSGQNQVQRVQRLTTSSGETPGPALSTLPSTRPATQPSPHEPDRPAIDRPQPVSGTLTTPSLVTHDAALLPAIGPTATGPAAPYSPAVPTSFTGTSAQNNASTPQIHPVETRFVEDTPDQPLPLDAIWPVERIDSKLNHPADQSPAPPESASAATRIAKIEQPLADAEYIRRALQSVSPEQATDSSVELITPRQPRPGSVRQSEAPRVLQREVEKSGDTQPDGKAEPAKAGTRERSDQANGQIQPEFSPLARSAARQEPPAYTINRGQDQQPYLVPTEIGPLPSDLWPLIGEPVPQRPPLTESRIPAADRQVQSAETASSSQTLIQRAVIIEEIGPETTESGTDSQRTAPPETSERDVPPARPAAADINLDELAHQVYVEIRTRLQVEWERLRHRL